jgi:glycosyltransferase involved in cell wall biosynthesis
LPVQRHSRVLVALEQHYRRGPDQHIYGCGPANYNFWTTYLSAFDEVVVLARVPDRNQICSEDVRADGPCVSFHALPDFLGPWQYLCSYPRLRARVREAVAQSDAYILRVPGLVGRLAWKEIRRAGRPYALEVVSDPWDTLGPGCVRGLLRPLLRRLAVRELRAMCRGAIAVHYVTRDALQRRYPPAKHAHAMGFSDAVTEEPFAPCSALEKRLARIESAQGDRGPFRIGFVGSLAQLYKGLDVLLRAVSLCTAQRVDIELLVAGGGRYAGEMKSLAKRLGIESRVDFLGELPYGPPILAVLDAIDLLVLPSYAEGLPRALIEAFARGCPCIATTVGGIPELLASEDLVPPRNSEALAQKIMEVASHRSHLRSMAERNFERANEFSPEQLASARCGFYAYVRRHSIT